MSVYYSDDSVTLLHGHVADVLPTLADGSVDCCVTSPPYYGLRDYGVDGQLGLEPSPAEYVEAMRGVFAEVRRVLADDGVMWLNIGDSYSAQPAGRPGFGATSMQNGGIDGSVRGKSVTTQVTLGTTGKAPAKHKLGVPQKNMLGVPWRVAFALQDDGWILRNAVIQFGDARLSARFWANINVNPETGCWEWNRSLGRGGYGVTRHKGRTSRTHRVTLALREQLIEGLQVDHLCRVRHCCNPAHLEQVTVRENSIRGISPELTRARNYARYGPQCPQGHDMSGENLYFDKRGWRRCHECQRKHCREYQARRYAALRARRELGESA